MATHDGIYVLIVAGGQGIRLKSDIPKQYLPLAGKPVLRHTIEAFLEIVPASHIKVVINPDHLKFYEHATTGLNLQKYALCGNTRKESVYNGIIDFSNVSDNQIVLIHDAARPLIEREDITKLLVTMKTSQAATLAYPIADSLAYADNQNTVGTRANRTNLWAIQTPQAFHFGVIKQAHEKSDPSKEYTDDTSLVSDLGIPVELVEGRRTNIKITHAEDLFLAEKFLSTNPATEIRTGQGFDVHAFDEEDAAFIRLCGIDVPYRRKLKGHSDADVGLHALTDAILGAIGEGDIGLHFPPSDMTFKNMDSAVFLRRAVELMQQKGGKIINADITLICEAPKIGTHRDAMRERVAEILDISSSRVNIKATTTEQLGFTGRKEGIAAQATASVSMPATD